MTTTFITFTGSARTRFAARRRGATTYRTEFRTQSVLEALAAQRVVNAQR
jgi:hypothetical protein